MKWDISNKHVFALTVAFIYLSGVAGAYILANLIAYHILPFWTIAAWIPPMLLILVIYDKKRNHKINWGVLTLCIIVIIEIVVLACG